MIIVRIVGGLGNQMFLYAYAKNLQQKGYQVKLDTTVYKKYKLHGGYQLDKYNITLKKADYLSIFLGKLKLKKNLKEKSLLFNAKLLSPKGKEYIKGYFQTENYFKEIRTILLKEFTVKKEFTKTTKNYQKHIQKVKNSCSIHIRRGDYITDPKANAIHGTCNLEYYDKAIQYISKKEKEITFFIFSDDITWVKNNLTPKNVVYVQHKTIPQEDLFLMSLCKHNIIANSSFSWWGAWLNKNNQKIIIAPKQWFVNKETEIVCKSWIAL